MLQGVTKPESSPSTATRAPAGRDESITPAVRSMATHDAASTASAAAIRRRWTDMRRGGGESGCVEVASVAFVDLLWKSPEARAHGILRASQPKRPHADGRRPDRVPARRGVVAARGAAFLLARPVGAVDRRNAAPRAATTPAHPFRTRAVL